MMKVEPFIQFCEKWLSLALLAGFLTMPATAGVHDITGQARAMHANVLGRTTILADSGMLDNQVDARQASLHTGYINTVGGAGEMFTSTSWKRSQYDNVDSVLSKASLTELDLKVGGNSIKAEYIMARVEFPFLVTAAESSRVDELWVNGMPVPVTGKANQRVDIVGGELIINERQDIGGVFAVNALHIVLDGVVDVKVASVSAGAEAGLEALDTVKGLQPEYEEGIVLDNVMHQVLEVETDQL